MTNIVRGCIPLWRGWYLYNMSKCTFPPYSRISFVPQEHFLLDDQLSSYYQASHSTWPAIPPGLKYHQALLPILPGSCVRWETRAILIVLQRLCVCECMIETSASLHIYPIFVSSHTYVSLHIFYPPQISHVPQISYISQGIHRIFGGIFGVNVGYKGYVG